MYRVIWRQPGQSSAEIAEHQTRSSAVIDAVMRAGTWKGAQPAEDHARVTMSNSTSSDTAAVLLFKGEAFVGLYSVERS